jgi:hypothetical protein
MQALHISFARLLQREKRDRPFSGSRFALVNGGGRKVQPALPS